ncbi:MAG TPA: diacylglycerol kinase family lipid kinase [Candidatus Brocadiia bacterium]|nr:diacylglycerol kinase family lipid kinase [Candidatus Brocadiia bacterium]
MSPICNLKADQMDSESHQVSENSDLFSKTGRMELIVNPISGQGKAFRLLDRIIKVWQSRGWDVHPQCSKNSDDVKRMAREIPDDTQLIAVSGGDGTLNQILNGLERFDIPIAILPAGTGNVLGKEMGLPKCPLKASILYEQARVVGVDMGVCNDRRFILVIGAGLDGEVVRDVHIGRDWHLSQWHYVPYMLHRVLFCEFGKVTVYVDGKLFAMDVHDVIVGNTKSYGGPISVTSEASMADGMFDICAFRVNNIFHFWQYGWAALFDRMRKEPGVLYTRGRKVEITSDEPVAYQLDGDPAGRLPASIEFAPWQVKLLWPTRTAEPSQVVREL